MSSNRKSPRDEEGTTNTTPSPNPTPRKMQKSAIAKNPYSRKTETSANLSKKFEAVAAEPEDKWFTMEEIFSNKIAGSNRKWNQTEVRKITDKETILPYTTEEVFGTEEGDDSIHDMSRLGSQLLGNPNKISIKEWYELTGKIFNQGKPEWYNGKSPVLRKFFLRLAKSDPVALFEKGTWNGQQLHPRNDTNAWAAAYRFFGAPWKDRENFFKKEAKTIVVDDASESEQSYKDTMEEDDKASQLINEIEEEQDKKSSENLSSQETVWDIIQDDLIMPTDLWSKEIITKWGRKIKPMKKEEIKSKFSTNFTLGPIAVDRAPDTILKPNLWYKAFHKAFDSKSNIGKTTTGRNLRIFAIRLAMTNPLETADPTFWKTPDKTGKRSMTNAWLGAYKLLGAGWERAEVLIPTSTPIGKDKEVTFSEVKKNQEKGEIGVLHKTKTGQYLSKALITIPKESMEFFKTRKRDSVVRSNNIFFKLKLPQTMAERAHEQTKEVIKNIQDIMQQLWDIDSSLVIRAWNAEVSDTQVIKAKHTFPNKRESIAQYFQGVYYFANRVPYIRVLLGFNKNISSFTTELPHEFKKWLTRTSAGFTKEKLQDRNICRAGWLLGSFPSVFNYEDMEDAIHSMEECKSIRVELKTEEVKTTKLSQSSWNQNFNGASRQIPVRAVYIWCTYDQTSIVRSKMKTLFSSKNTKKLLGKNLRFIPHILDNRFITTDKSALLTTKMKNKQKRFLQQTTFTATNGILGLDYVIPSLHVSLRQALMSIRSKEDPDKNVFVSVDGWGDQVRFAFNMNIADEAERLIPALPIFLEATLGPAVWTWFSDQVQRDCSDFEWDPENGIVDRQNGNSQGMLGEDDSIESDNISDDAERLDIEFNESSAKIFSLNLGNFGPNQYEDGGSVATKALFPPNGRNSDVSAETMSQPATVVTDVSSRTENSPFSSLTASITPKLQTSVMKQMAQAAMESLRQMPPAELQKMLNKPPELTEDDPTVEALQGVFQRVVFNKDGTDTSIEAQSQAGTEKMRHPKESLKSPLAQPNNKTNSVEPMQEDLQPAAPTEAGGGM